MNEKIKVKYKKLERRALIGHAENMAIERALVLRSINEKLLALMGFLSFFSRSYPLYFIYPSVYIEPWGVKWAKRANKKKIELLKNTRRGIEPGSYCLSFIHFSGINIL